MFYIVQAVVRHYQAENVLKYLSRAGKKGEEIEDLEKALWYLKRHIDNVRKENEGNT